MKNVPDLKGLLIGRLKHHIGHNPAGGFMIVILLMSLLSLTLTGLKAYGVKGYGPLAKNEISFMTNAFADSDDTKNHDEHDGRKQLSQKNHTIEEIWTATISTFLAKFLFAMTFVVPLVLFTLSTAIVK